MALHVAVDTTERPCYGVSKPQQWYNVQVNEWDGIPDNPRQRAFHWLIPATNPELRVPCLWNPEMQTWTVFSEMGKNPVRTPEEMAKCTQEYLGSSWIPPSNEEKIAQAKERDRELEDMDPMLKMYNGAKRAASVVGRVLGRRESSEEESVSR